MKSVLTIGTVVKIKDTKKSVMIVGVKQINKKDKKLYDYIAVPYPEGFINAETFIVFDNKDIEDINYFGYLNSEMQVYLTKIKELQDKDNKSKEMKNSKGNKDEWL